VTDTVSEEIKKANALYFDEAYIEALNLYQRIASRPGWKHLVQANISLCKKRLGPAAATSAYCYLDPEAPARLPLKKMIAKLAAYDVISFDIFDTAIVRAVARPTDVFRIMGLRLGVTGFSKNRKEAEAYARTRNDRLKGTREVTLHEIYQVLVERHGAKAEWEQFEKDLEIQLTQQNPYIFQVYERLRMMGKTLIFMSDMYLPKEVLEAMLAKAGYNGYERIYLSNEHGARKGDGTLQRLLIADYGPKRSIIHVGDVYEADVEKSIAAGIAAVHNPNQHVLIREKDMGNLAGSFYEAVVDNVLGTGTWSRGIHYTHGFRVGGILTLGYIEFLDRLARDKGAEKILFLGRDCDILSQVYKRFFGKLPSEYVEISRSAVLPLVAGWNFDEYIDRIFFRWYRDSNNSRPINQLLIDTGFEYLIEHLEDADIEPFQFPMSTNVPRLREFFWAKKSVIEAHLSGAAAAARDYFSAAIGDARKILVVDIGWTGTCIAMLREFLQNSLEAGAPQVFGALLATSRNEQITDAISSGSISSYIYSPIMNQDITRLIMPSGDIPQKKRDLLTHPIEYMFTEPKATTIGYEYDATGKAVARRGFNIPQNPQQILEMQRGIIDFVERYLEYSRGLADLRMIGGYVAFQPLRNGLSNRPYLYEIYKDFFYDAAPLLNTDVSMLERFGDLFEFEEQCHNNSGYSVSEKIYSAGQILFVSPEMKYVGAPQSLLRLCKVAAGLGYEPVVWTAQPGPFEREFKAQGFRVYVVPANKIDKNRIDELIRDNVKLVVCNTVVTHEYVRAFEGKLPVVWYVREATNVPQFLRGNPGRQETLKHSSSITVVSDYAAQAVSKYAEGPIEVVKNAVEDVSTLALPYTPAKGGIIRFVQLGTIEHRKGYDLFVAAYKAMPATYQSRAELHFAGGFINSGTSFASYLFGQIKGESGIHYHGLIADERKKIELLSQMDVVVVASRDESCSLVALEGAMLSKPLIVTENVGAKYMVGDENGWIVPSGEVLAMRDAFMRMIDLSPSELGTMGTASRLKYDRLASMNAHRRELGDLFARRIAAGPTKLSQQKSGTGTVSSASAPSVSVLRREIIVSLTSFPPRMPTIAACIESLKHQTKQPNRILLWLSEDQFPGRDAELPAELCALADRQFEIRWVAGDLAPHKKYFYAMREFPDALVVTVDDDVRYDRDLIATLYQAHLEHPLSVVAGRSNLIRFRPNGVLRTYDSWGYEYQYLREMETFALLPTGIGGVLYPPGSVPAEAFDVSAIEATSLYADDLWLKVMTTANGYPVWMPQRKFEYRNIDGSQGTALWRGNAFRDGNDLAIRSILEFIEQKYGIAELVLRRIWGVRADGTVIGPGDEIDRSPLLT